MFSQKQNKKYHSKTQLDEKKTYLFMMFLITSFFPISPLRARWLLLYIIKNNSSEGLSSSTTNHSPCLDQCNGKIKLIAHLCCPFRTNYTSSHQRYSMKKGVFRNFTKFTGKGLYQGDCFYNHLDLYRHLHCNSKC